MKEHKKLVVGVASTILVVVVLLIVGIILWNGKTK